MYLNTNTHMLRKDGAYKADPTGYTPDGKYYKPEETRREFSISMKGDVTDEQKEVSWNELKDQKMESVLYELQHMTESPLCTIDPHDKATLVGMLSSFKNTADELYDDTKWENMTLEEFAKIDEALAYVLVKVNARKKPKTS